ncbi:MAG: hypothetical protein ACT4TC_05275, partial [Myxococcaceae bacterium]
AIVVRGRVGQQQSSWDEGQHRIETFTEIQVTDFLKGGGPKTFLVRQPGGVVDGVGQKVAGAAKFQSGEDVILFLQPASDDRALFMPLGLSAGKVMVYRDRAIRRLSGLAFYAPKDPKPGLVQPVDIEDLGSVDSFCARIRRAAGTGGAK